MWKFKATLIKGKTCELNGFVFDANDPKLKTQIVDLETAKKLERCGRFRIEKVGMTTSISIIEKPDIVFLAGHISLSDGYGCLGNKVLKKYITIVQSARDNLDYSASKTKDLSAIPPESYIIQLTSPNRYRDITGFKRRFGFTMFETTKIPKNWAKNIKDTCDELIVPAEEVRKVFENCGVKVPIHVVPLWVDDCYQYFERPKRKIFKFLHVGTLNNFDRKGCLIAVEAFKKEFKKEKDISLIIKCANLALNSTKIKQIAQDDRIKFIKELYSDEEMNELYKNVDCFVYPTHGEGFGLPPLEAMATGLPTIVTNWMGCKEFVNYKVCYPLEVSELEESLYPKDYGSTGNWAVINVKDVRKAMRYVYEYQEKAKRKGKLASQYVNKLFRFKNFDDNLKVALGLREEVESLIYEDKVSIVMAVKDNLKYLKLCLYSLFKLTKAEFELILIDNDSNREVKDFLKRLKRKHKNVRVLTNLRNMGYAYACNQGIKLAKYNYICMMDIDTIVTPNWLTKMLDCMKRKEDCGICSPSQAALKGITYAPFVRDRKINIIDDVANFSKTLKDGFEEKQIFQIYGFCHLVKREVYEKVGVYDWKKYYKLASNETDLYWRAGLKRYKLYWVKGAYVHHFHSKVKLSLGIDAPMIAQKGHEIFKERQKEPENYYVQNDAMVESPKEKVGIVYVTHNNSKNIKRTIKSVLTQSYYNWKLFIIDNNSKNNAQDIIKKFDDDRIEYFYLDKFNEKPFEIGIKKCRTKYIAFLEDNYIFTSKHLEKMMRMIKKKDAQRVWCFNSVIRYNKETYETENMSLSNLLTTKKALLRRNEVVNLVMEPGILTKYYDNKELEKLSKYFNE